MSSVEFRGGVGGRFDAFAVSELPLGGSLGGGPAGGLNVLVVGLMLGPSIDMRGGADETAVGTEFKVPVNCRSNLGKFSGVSGAWFLGGGVGGDADTCSLFGAGCMTSDNPVV
jgi:hypothetical protein